MIKNKRGFTLIEVILAMAILGIIVFAFSSMFTNAYRSILSAGRRSVAVHDSEKQLEFYIANGIQDENEETLIIDFGDGIELQLKGAEKEQIEIYEQAKNISLKTFVVKDSVSSGNIIIEADTDLRLLIYADELNLVPGSSYKLESNKPVEWESINPSIASVDVNGIITAHTIGETMITATAVSELYGTETLTCIVNVMNNILLRDVQGGTYVSFDGDTYLKLTGANGRVLELEITSFSIEWNSDIEAPYEGEITDGLWDDTRRLANGEYWTKTNTGNNVSYVTIAGSIQRKGANQNTSNLRKALSLRPMLQVSEGAGTFTSPYVLIDVSS